MGQRTSKGCFFLLVLTETLFALLGEKMFNLDQYRRIGMHEAGVRVFWPALGQSRQTQISDPTRRPDTMPIPYAGSNDLASRF